MRSKQPILMQTFGVGCAAVLMGMFMEACYNGCTKCVIAVARGTQKKTTFSSLFSAFSRIMPCPLA
eukprot:74316-Pelagomonas_calceolata.AAC.3